MKGFFAILLIVPLTFFSQNWKVLGVEELSQVFNDIAATSSKLRSYKVDTYYASYKGEDSKIPYDESQGYFLKIENTYKSEMMGVKTIQSKELKIMLFDEEKLMVLASPDQLSGSFSVEEFKENLSLSEKIMQKKEEDFVRYKVSMKKGVAIDNYEIKVGKDHLIYHVVINYARDVNWEDETGKEQKIKPKVEISYKNYKIPYSEEGIVSTSEYVTITKQKITPLGKYKSYRISDTRYQP